MQGENQQFGERSTGRLPLGRVHLGLSPLRWWTTFRHDVARLRSDRFALTHLTTSQLKVIYQRSVLGFLWSLLTPLLMLTVLYLAFVTLLGIDIPNFGIYLFSGHVPWQFFSFAVDTGSRSLVSHEAILRKFSIHPMVFPLSAVLVAAANMVFATTALFILLQFFGARPTVQLVLLLPAVILITSFTIGLVLIAVTFATRFRDLEHIIPVLLLATFFTTPVFFTPEHLGPYRVLMDCNPLTYHTGLFRCALYSGTWPTPMVWAVAVGSTAVSLVVGYALFKRHERNIIFLL